MPQLRTAKLPRFLIFSFVFIRLHGLAYKALCDLPQSGTVKTPSSLIFSFAIIRLHVLAYVVPGRCVLSARYLCRRPTVNCLPNFSGIAARNFSRSYSAGWAAPKPRTIFARNPSCGSREAVI
ncbi:protein of unknown function [Methylocaldum szegediense]|uniref:Secreted protein n=1 Tax=Methylocaldum szegediense TaxID=73780 RepID=A0ABN8WZ25_9GAMM|nr:protein of unknown function [Methylocaldum szegediense]